MEKGNLSARHIFGKIFSEIKIYEKEEATAIAFIILEYFQISKPDVLTDKNISFKKNEELAKILERLNKSEPIQYILGESHFYGRKFKVNPAVLIPRPETEELADHIIKENYETLGLKILDIGTGSGCIAITLFKELINAEVYAVDISEEALATARVNSAAYACNIDFSKFDILQDPKFKVQNLNIIVSNPPYVTESEKTLMQKNVLMHEPSHALFVDDEDPLKFYTAIIKFAQKHLVSGGKCYLEINEKFGKEISALLSGENFREVRIIKDLNEKDRFVCGIFAQ